jgi:hypothetical protein
VGRSAATTSLVEPGAACNDAPCNDAPRNGRARRLRGTVLVAVVAVASLAAAVVALGGDGSRPVGSPIRSDEAPAPGHPPTGVPETVLATGSSPIAGRWQITEFASQTITDNGDVVQPEGLPCVKFLLLDPPPGWPLVGNSQCGLPHGDLEVMSLPVQDGASGKVEVILWGRVAEGTRSIELSAEGASPIRVAPEPGPADFAGDVWAIAASPDLEKASVNRLDDQLRPIGPPVDAASDIARARAFAR